MKACFVSQAGGILAHCVRYLIFLPHRGPAVVKNIPPLDAGLLGFSVLPSSIILCQAGDTALLTLGWESDERQRGFLLPAPWRPSEMSAFPGACRLCHSSYPGLDADFLPLSQPGRRRLPSSLAIVRDEHSNVPAKERENEPPKFPGLADIGFAL